MFQIKSKNYVIIIGLTLIIVLSLGCSRPHFSEENWRKRTDETQTNLLYAKHEENGEYFNPWLRTNRGLSDVLTWKLSSTEDYTEEEWNYLPKVLSNVQERLLKTQAENYILWIGHGSFIVKTGDQVWLLDPMFSKRALLPSRLTPPALTAKDINDLFPNVNVVISHNHYDHLDEDSIRELSSDYDFYVPLGLKSTIRDWKPQSKIIEMDWWQKLTIRDGFELHCLPAQHWSNRVFEGRNTSLWASYMIVAPDVTIYFGGDSGYFIGYREISKKYPKIDYALIPITAYHPRWFMHEAHMNIDEAIDAFHDLSAAFFIPTQWGTFHLGDEPAGYPGLDLKRTIQKRGLEANRYLILDIGGFYEW